MYFNYICMLVVMAACCYGQDVFGTAGLASDPALDASLDALLGPDPLTDSLFGRRRRTCPCDSKTRTRFVQIPNRNALTLRQFDRFVEGNAFLGVYEIKVDNPVRPIPSERQLGFEIVFGRRNGNGNFGSTSQYRRRRPQRCIRRRFLNRRISRRRAIFELARTRQRAFDTYFSSCPDKYIWVMRCYDRRALRTGRCPSRETVLKLLVPRRRNFMDDLPLQHIQEDLTRATSVRLCQSSNLKQNFILGDNRCRRRLPRPRPRRRTAGLRAAAGAEPQQAAEASFAADAASLDAPLLGTESGFAADAASFADSAGFPSELGLSQTVDQGLGEAAQGLEAGIDAGPGIGGTEAGAGEFTDVGL